MPIVEVRVVPVGTDQPSFSSLIAACRGEVEGRGLRYDVTATGTVMEADLGAALDVARAMHEVAFREGAERVITTVTVDERHDKPQDMREMVLAVTRADA